MAMARMRRACLASAVRAASARNCEILRSWRVISIADMMPAPRIIDVLHRVTFADGWESHRSQVLRRLVLDPSRSGRCFVCPFSLCDALEARGRVWWVFEEIAQAQG